MGARKIINLRTGSTGSTGSICGQGLINDRLGLDKSKWSVKSIEDNWVCVWVTDTLGDEENDQILLLPRQADFITKESLMSIWFFIQSSGANLTFDDDIAAAYSKITILGSSQLEGAISLKQEENLKNHSDIERILCSTAEELIQELQERRDKKIFFKGGR